MTPESFPDDAELDAIAAWPKEQGYHGLMAEVLRLRWVEYGGWREEPIDDGKAVRYTLATGGWSGNEELIGALQENIMFWWLCWQSSDRGGRHVFEIAVEEAYREP